MLVVTRFDYRDVVLGLPSALTVGARVEGDLGKCCQGSSSAPTRKRPWAWVGSRSLHSRRELEPAVTEHKVSSSVTLGDWDLGMRKPPLAWSQEPH